MEKKYTLNEIVNEAVSRFQIDTSDRKNTNYTSTCPGDIRKKFEVYVKKTKDATTNLSLWDSAVDKDYEEDGVKKANGKSYHFFTKQQMEDILSSDEIYDYIMRYTNRKDLPRKELDLLIEEGKIKWYQYNRDNGLPQEPYIGTTPSETDFEQKKATIMLTALFELFFNPIDDNLLYNDMVNARFYGGDTETRATMASKLRIKDDHNYYTLKNNILDSLTDKIVKKLQENKK